MGILLALVLAATVTVKVDKAALRSGGCDEDAETIAELVSGTPVDLKFALNGSCYKVGVLINGTQKTGYLTGEMLSDVTTFDKARQSGSSVGGSGETPKMEAAAVENMRRALTGTPSSNPALIQASHLIEANQPGAALVVLESLVKQRTSNPDVYMLAGVAAWKNDQPREALDFWKTSLDLRPNTELDNLYKKVEREVAGDKSGERLIGLRVLLRYETELMPLSAAKQMLEILDSEISRISQIVGCQSSERLVAIVQSREAYFQTTQAAEWSGGQYNGKIRVPYDPTRSPAAIKKLFGHEVVHACLANMGQWPAWLHEGLAQKLSGETLRPEMRDKIRVLAANHALPKLDEFRRDWSGLNTENAFVAYGVALQAADLLFENYANTGLLNILRNPSLLVQVTADLNKRLGL